MKLVIALLVTCCLATSQAKAVVPNHQNTDTDREITVPESIVSSLNTAINNVPKMIPHSVMPILPDIAAIVAHVVTSNLPNSSEKTDELLRRSDEAAQFELREVLEKLNIPVPASVEGTLQGTFGKWFKIPKRPIDSTPQDGLSAALREIEVILPDGAENFAILNLYDAIPKSLLPVFSNIAAIAIAIAIAMGFPKCIYAPRKSQFEHEICFIARWLRQGSSTSTSSSTTSVEIYFTELNESSYCQFASKYCRIGGDFTTRGGSSCNCNRATPNRECIAMKPLKTLNKIADYFHISS